MDDKGFKLLLSMTAEQEAKEYSELRHEQQRLELKIEQTRRYIEKINAFLVSEGHEPVPIPDCEDIEGPLEGPAYMEGERIVTQPANRPKPVGEKAEGVNS